MTDKTESSDHHFTGINRGRRKFLKLTGMVGLGIPFVSLAHLTASSVSIVTDAADSMASSAPVQWAAKELEQAFMARGITVSRHEKLSEAKAGGLVIAIAGATTATVKDIAGIAIPAMPEALGLVPSKTDGKQILIATGHDERGLVYALLELADRVKYSQQPLNAVNIQHAVVEQPANKVRSLTRLFTSDVEDKPWFNDRDMWPQYLTMLATQRFNKFNLCFGIGYDFLQKVTDAYFLFAYPFLFDLPGYNVHVPQLSDAERDANLAMLKYISEQTVGRGLQFQLGLWMHGYEWLNTTNANYTIEGLNKDNHAAYCRDAVRYLLQQCPAISGITFRVHGESGVTEGSYDFWKAIFDGVRTCGRVVEIDMHAKGMDQTMIDNAVATGLPITISPKYWAEHMGMPYHQADIRALEIPDEKHQASGLMNLSAGSRSFLRYGYGDLMKEDRRYKIVHRIWPGTQRLLLWGDPVTAAAHAKAFGFCGSDGVELMEPLSFKGRRGSGIAGDRCGYADESLKPKWDWEKYLYTLRIFGRMLYNPAAAADTWQRYIRHHFGAGASGAETALANVSRILPVVLTTHGASAGNNMYWPEMYTNQPITDPAIKNTYTDTPSPKTFGNVTPLDPQLFLSINDFAKELLAGESSGKYNAVEVAQWLENYANSGDRAWADAETKSTGKNTPEYRRMAIDIAVQTGLGYFFAAKFRSAFLYAVYEQSNDRKALEEALVYYRKARESWAGLAGKTSRVYKADITVGEHPWLRGHWQNRLPAIDEDLANMAKKLADYSGNPTIDAAKISKAIQYAKGKPVRAKAGCHHSLPLNFQAGQPLDLTFDFDKTPVSAVLYYRHVSQAERYQKASISFEANKGKATIPGSYTDSHYPLEYYVMVKSAAGTALLYPGFNEEQAGQPYFTVRKA